MCIRDRRFVVQHNIETIVCIRIFALVLKSRLSYNCLLYTSQLIKRDLVRQYTGDAELEQLGKCLLERPFSEWYRGSFGHICGLPRRIAMGLLQHSMQLQAFIPDFTTESDAVFALNNICLLYTSLDWKRRYWYTKAYWVSEEDETSRQAYLNLSLIHI